MGSGGGPWRGEPYIEARHADVDAGLVLLCAFRRDLVQQVEVRPGVLREMQGFNITYFIQSYADDAISKKEAISLHKKKTSRRAFCVLVCVSRHAFVYVYACANIYQ